MTVIKAIFFDLDGTFADTAPDLNFALNQMLELRGLLPMPLSATRPVTSLGARGLLNVGFGMPPEHPDYRAMREEFLAVYERNICRKSRPFPGIDEVLASIETRRIAWGIVTNKAERLARLLLGTLEIAPRARCIIGGDSTGHLKPHPQPLLAACHAVGLDPSSCIYVGDDRRDVEAGFAAGMKTVVARWGYLNGGNAETWGANWIIEKPQDLLPIIDQMV
jgi:N-acetyl-D-muramate 6-phosphate phosphatase